VFWPRTNSNEWCRDFTHDPSTENKRIDS
jgi:hypothetical protein